MKSLIDGFDVYNINPNRELLGNEREEYLKDVYGVSTVNINDRQNMNIFYNKILTCKWADKNLCGYSIYSDYDVIQKRSIVGLEMKRLVLDCEHGKHYIPQEILKRYGIGREIKKYDKLFIYGREDRDIDGVEYVKAPVFEFHKKFDRVLYINSNRGFDCSLRILVECVYMGKGIEIYDRKGLENLKDGGYWRVRDIESGIDRLIMKSGDEILKILDEI